ncbi:MAG: hypothetical protein NVS2B12_07240 [Ktedonobacteraceae bacterium]
MRDFERHDPGGDSVRDPMDDDQAWEDQIQFVDLDPPGTSSTVGNVLRRLPSPALRMSRRTRWYIAAASIIGLLVLLVQIGYPIWGKLLLDDHILYVGAYDGTIYALHDDGRLLWRYSTKQSVGLLSTANGQLFIQGNSESDSISALRVSDGVLLWQRPMGQTAYFQSGAFLIVGRIVYVMTVDGTINALREADGSLLWHRRILRPPLPLNDLLYASMLEGGVSALWAHSGVARWHAG